MIFGAFRICNNILTFAGTNVKFVGVKNAIFGKSQIGFEK